MRVREDFECIPLFLSIFGRPISVCPICLSVLFRSVMSSMESCGLAIAGSSRPPPDNTFSASLKRHSAPPPALTPLAALGKVRAFGFAFFGFALRDIL